MSTEQDQPLRRQLTAQADRLRAEYLREGFTRDDYHHLIERADQTIAEAGALGIDAPALAPLRESRAVLFSVLKLLSDPSAQAVAPSNNQVYREALKIARLARLTGQLKGAPRAWRDQLAALLGEMSGQDDQAARRLVLLEFATLCRASGIHVEPAGTLGAEIEFDEWTLAACPAIAEKSAGVAAAAKEACSGLVAMKRPGIVVIDAGAAMPDAPSLRRVANDRTAEIEMQRHVDQFIIDYHEEMVEAVDTQFAFAAVVGAVLHSVNVSTRRVNFAACYRMVNLCDPEDARAPRLRRFMDRFSNPAPNVR